MKEAQRPELTLCSLQDIIVRLTATYVETNRTSSCTTSWLKESQVISMERGYIQMYLTIVVYDENQLKASV